MIVDSHCHLDYPGLAEQEAAVLSRAHGAGVGLLVTIATRRASWRPVIELAERNQAVVCALGVHPHHAGEDGLADADALLEHTAHPKVVGIGESGLDYFYDHAPRDAQARSFRSHIEAARRSGLPLVVHTRDADEDTATILEEEMARGAFTGVIHCFSSSRRLAERAVALGFCLGVGGMLTFKRSEELRSIVAAMPLERLILETDAPYLAPVPYRGRTNEPAYTAFTARALAAVKGIAQAEVEHATTAAFFRLFPKAEAFRPLT